MNATPIRQTAKLTLTRRAFDSDPVNQSRRYFDQSVECEVTIEIDADSLARVLGRKALSNKSRKAKEVGGLVVVSVREIQP